VEADLIQQDVPSRFLPEKIEPSGLAHFAGDRINRRRVRGAHSEVRLRYAIMKKTLRRARSRCGCALTQAIGVPRSTWRAAGPKLDRAAGARVCGCLNEEYLRRAEVRE